MKKNNKSFGNLCREIWQNRLALWRELLVNLASKSSRHAAGFLPDRCRIAAALRFLENGAIDLAETSQRVKLAVGQQSRAIWCKSDEPFFCNNIKHKKMSYKSGSVTRQGLFAAG